MLCAIPTGLGRFFEQYQDEPLLRPDTVRSSRRPRFWYPGSSSAELICCASTYLAADCSGHVERLRKEQRCRHPRDIVPTIMRRTGGSSTPMLGPRSYLAFQQTSKYGCDQAIGAANRGIHPRRYVLGFKPRDERTQAFTSIN